jgi:hypothetical protein
MAPEQIKGQPLPSSDIYALGVILYRMLTSQLPYSSSGPSIYIDHLQAPIPRISTIRPDLSVALDQVIINALAKSPAERFKSADILLKSFQTAIIPPAPKPIATSTPKPADLKPPRVVEAEKRGANPPQQPIKKVNEPVADQKRQQPRAAPKQQQEQVGMQAEKVTPSPQKKTLAERRQAFIERIYPGISSSAGIWLLPLSFLTGLGSVLDTYAQYQLVIVVMAATALLGYLLAHRKTTSFFVFILILLFSGVMILLPSEKIFHVLPIAQQKEPGQTSIWLLGPRYFWVGRQVNAGLIIGSLPAFIMHFLFCVESSTTKLPFIDNLVVIAIFSAIVSVPTWLIVSVFATIFNWGFGFGDSWYIGLLYLLIGFIAAIGLADFIYVLFKRFE